MLVLVTGLAADSFPRRRIIQAALAVEACCGHAILAFSLEHLHLIWPLDVLLVCLGTARAFFGPAGSSLAPILVPPQALANAVTMNATAWQLAGIVGPVVGGLLYGIGPAVAYGTAVALGVVAALAIGQVRRQPRIRGEPSSVQTLLAGFRYIFDQKVVLG